ncbi:MAG: DUF4348 domain-containing protein [Prevotellaceae bacterium]|jgi:hypothetical protein|nr:DUF4348 domain-containing protein [Prevotellaceae bacterium]
MKTLQWGVCLFVLIMSCGCKKAGSPHSATAHIPSPVPAVTGDTVVPKSASPRQTFDDFIYKQFADESYYTLLFDNEAELELEGDTAFTDMQVEWFDLDSCAASHPSDGTDDDFIAFYARFVSDSLYQRAHICNPLEFVTLDPDDEFNILETTLDIDAWYAFNPMLPKGKLSNINYGQQNNTHSPTKILKVNGIGNGFSNIYYFRKQNGVWELYKYEDTGV